MKTDKEKFVGLWEHVNSFWEPSNLMFEIKKVLEDFMMTKEPDIRPLLIFSERIAKHVDWEYFRQHELVAKVQGEWHITNSDLEFWANLCLFGKRDYFPKKWNWLSSSITNAIHKKRRWQTLQQYYKRGLSEDHRKLLQRLGWDINFWRGDGISLYVQGKRPFGNSCITCDMIEILGWEFPPEDDDIPKEIEEKCWELFDELQFAIYDVLIGR